MKVAIISKIVFENDMKSFKRTWDFIENGESKHVVEVESLHNIIQSVIIRDIINGRFGNKHKRIYKWLNPPTKIVKGNSVIKQNYKKL